MGWRPREVGRCKNEKGCAIVCGSPSRCVCSHPHAADQHVVRSPSGRSLTSSLWEQPTKGSSSSSSPHARCAGLREGARDFGFSGFRDQGADPFLRIQEAQCLQSCGQAQQQGSVTRGGVGEHIKSRWLSHRDMGQTRMRVVTIHNRMRLTPAAAPTPTAAPAKKSGDVSR